MKKLKIYLDTSVISHLQAEDTPEKMQDTLCLWKDISYDKYDVFLSDVTLSEILDCKQPKRDVMLNFLTDINYTKLLLNKEIELLANQIISLEY